MSKQFEKFDSAIRELLKVPHSEIKTKLDEEKAAKKAKKTRSKKNDTRNQNNH
jgi:hypothetical protein